MKKEEIAVRPTNTALERPSFIQDSKAGHENIGSKDIRPPALRLAQSTSKEVKRSEQARYIEGLSEGEFFNSLTKEVYGDAPLYLLVVNPLGHRHVEFDRDGKVIDFNVRDDDQRTKWSEEIKDGVAIRVKPKATMFYDYVVLVLLDDAMPWMTMSLKSTQLKKAQEINTVIKQGSLPCYAYRWKVTPVPESSGGRSWYGWRFERAGWPDEAQYNRAQALYNELAEKVVHVEDEEDEKGEPFTGQF